MNNITGQLSAWGLGKDFVDYGKIFLRETSIFLRYDQDGAACNVPVTCEAASAKSNIVTMIWPDGGTGEVHSPPSVNAKVTCITMLRGRLLQLPARVSGLYQEKQLTLMLAMDKAARVINLRKHPRYSVYGWVLMGEFASSESRAQQREMNISLGGFGANPVERQWAVGGQYPFKLSAAITAALESDSSLPSLKINGSAVVRRHLPAAEPNLLRVGAEFCELAPEDSQKLKAWIEDNRAHLREA